MKLKIAKRQYIIAFFMGLFLININLFAQPKSAIEGYVLDAQTGDPLVGANVWLDLTGYGSATDGDGKFWILNVPEGSYLLKVSYVGYQEFSETIQIAAGENVEKVYELEYAGNIDETETIIVTAQAKGQISAINEQLNSKSIKNVIAAERIQELPDANAAESVGRLPGVSIQRSGGEANKVVVRGLSPKYNKIQIEGVSMAASSSIDRSTDISMISPYSLDGIEVIKSATADHDADFVGGTVNFKLREAEPGWQYDVVSQGGYNNLKSAYNDYMITGNLSNRLFDDTFGFYLQANIEKRNRSANEMIGNFYIPPKSEVEENNIVYTKNFGLSDVLRKRLRTGATLVLDYRIPDGSLKLKNFYSESETEVDRHKQFYNVVDRIHSYDGRRDKYESETFSSIFDYSQRFEALGIDGKISYSNSKAETPKSFNFQFNQQNGIATEALNGSYSPKEVIAFSEIDDSLAWLDKITDTRTITEESQFEVALNAQYQFTLSKQINGFLKLGGKYRHKDRLHDRTTWGANLRIGDGRSNVAILDAYPWMRDKLGLDPDDVDRLPYYLFNIVGFDHKEFINGEYAMGAVTNLNFMEDVLAVLRQSDNADDDLYDYNRSSTTFDYSGDEYYNAAYMLSEINFGRSMKFIPGFRYEKNKTVYTGNRGIVDIAFIEQNYPYHDTTFTRTNDYILPMIHFKYSPVEWFDIRLAYTQTLSRPNYNQIMPRLDVWPNEIFYNNYTLKPEQSENYDLYLSFQENYIGLFTAGLFVKNIDNMIFDLGKRVFVDSTAYDLPAEYLGKYIYTFANNKETANLWGIELDWQTNFWYLPSALKGLILNINYTHVFSEAKYPKTFLVDQAEYPWDPPNYINVDTFYTRQLIDQPDDIINLQIGYDYKDFSARLSMLYQTSIFKKADHFVELSEDTDAYLRWDFSVKQKLPWYNIQLFCNINNITNALDRDLVKGAKWDALIQHYGMTMDFGIRVKL
jgi:TonB-dependent receptor